ncbi:phosphopentomutase [Luxibacter massiliensis]|uniref:phosphopentomutase n=1 Tax=Luxibacter massiliensis TaxID=2219695 RepID=UPI000F05B3BE|nr:phosphopentomutase [Luxibacter massiliensis]
MGKRVFLIVLDSFGIGYEPDADVYGDVGSNTLNTIAKSDYFRVPQMQKLGLFNIDQVECGAKIGLPLGAYGRLREKSKGKDTTAGHWEISGIVSDKPFPIYPAGFPKEILSELTRQTGREILCNLPYSGTEVIRDYGKEHIETGKLIVYTSADSVFQIAAHEEVVPLEDLYEYCKIARRILVGKHNVGRVIARPFNGTYPDFHRTANRHDFALAPPRKTMLDVLKDSGKDVISIGKIFDIFAGRGITSSNPTKCNAEGIDKLLEIQNIDFQGLCFLNLVDFDMVYGHRNDIDGYAQAAAEFDIGLTKFMGNMGDGDIVMITADHGCDPGFPGTDHTREYIPFLAYGKIVRGGINLGTRNSFSDIGKTILDIFGLPSEIDGHSFWDAIKR